jgi:hypothetical protein
MWIDNASRGTKAKKATSLDSGSLVCSAVKQDEVLLSERK